MNIYLDCGTHVGEGLATLIQKYHMSDAQWKIFAFEPNRDSYEQVLTKQFQVKRFLRRPWLVKHITFFNKAVWITDGQIEFHAETPPASAKSDGAGSSLISLDDWTPKSETNPGVGDFDNSYKVESVHLGKFIKDNFSQKDFIVLKLDIEGAEFAILSDMINSGAIKYINDLYVEFHEWAMNSQTEQSKLDLIAAMKKANRRMNLTVWQ